MPLKISREGDLRVLPNVCGSTFLVLLASRIAGFVMTDAVDKLNIGNAVTPPMYYLSNKFTNKFNMPEIDEDLPFLFRMNVPVVSSNRRSFNETAIDSLSSAVAGPKSFEKSFPKPPLEPPHEERIE